MLDENNAKVMFGRFIRNGRENQKLNQTKAAEQIGISQQYYSHIEKGMRNVDLVLALKICEALYLNLNDFIKLLQNETQ
mgnify:CR=1 FL=1